MSVHHSVSSSLVRRRILFGRVFPICRLHVAAHVSRYPMAFLCHKLLISLLINANSVVSVYVLSLSVPIPCTDVCCRFRSQHNHAESPSYDLQARTPSSMISRKDSCLHSRQTSRNVSVEGEHTLAFKRRTSPGRRINLEHNSGCQPSPMEEFAPLKRRRHTPASIKIENDGGELPSKAEGKTAQDLEYHSWKLSAVEVECRHCSERKLLSCSYLKLSPTLVQSGIVPRIPCLEGESACCAKPKERAKGEEWRVPRTATCA